MLILLLKTVNKIIIKKVCKKNLVRSFSSSYCKIIFILLTKIMINYIIIILIYIWESSFKKTFLKIF